MKPEDWALIESLFNEALELDVSLREPFLREKEDAQPEIIAEVRKLLKSNEKSSTFLDSPALYQFSLSQPNEQSGNYAGNEADQYTDIFLGRRFGVYRLVEQIGRGGMGAVYRAFRDDGEFKHQVAVKLLKRGMDTDFIIQRFKNERQILASFDHPFIARLIDGGTTIEGLPYFVMEFIEGKNIYDFCDENRYSIRERLETFLKVCSAVEYAHSLGVVHRDIKPGNILVTSTGLPKLLDFGIAKILDPSLAHDTVNPTGSMLRLMTPDYASPEQIRGINITTSSDIYSLGVLLYELLTGHKPFNFEGLALHEITKTVCEEIPVIPGAVFNFPERLLRNYKGRLSNVIECRQTKLEELVSELSGPLGEIIMRPLQKDPSERYADVKEFSNEIQKYLRGDRFTAFSTLALIEKSTSISAALESIAVLPFKVIDFSGNGTTEYKYLEIGLADALTTRLGKLRRFQVRPTSAVVNSLRESVDPLTAGRILRTKLLVEGNIKITEDRIRVSLQLLDIAKTSVLWATTLDAKPNEILTLEETLALELSEALLPQLTRNEIIKLSKRGTDNPEAFEHYIRGRYHFNAFTEEALAEAFVAYHKAIAADPNFAMAFCGIADYYNWLGIIGILEPRECFLPAIEAATHAVQLDPSLSIAHATLGFSLHAGKYDWAGAERHLKKAIELDPVNATSYVWYSIVLYCEGRFEEGLGFARRAIELDPLTPFNLHNLGWGLYYARRFDESIAEYKRMAEEFPNYPFAHYGLSKAYRIIGDLDSAEFHSRKTLEIMSGGIFAELSIAENLAAAGKKEQALDKLDEIRTNFKKRYISPYQTALVYAYLGDKESTIAELENAQSIDDAWLNWLGVEPAFDLIRDDPRFLKILEFTGYLPFFVKDKEYRSLFYINQKSRERLHSSDFPTALFQSKEVISTASSADNSSTNKIKRYLQPILALSVILGLALAIAYYFGFLTIDFQDKTNAGYDNPFEQPSILIVPFASADQDSENLAVGLADALAQRLGNLKALQVLSPSTGRMFANSTPEEIYAATSARMLMRGKIDSAAPQPNVYVELIDCRESKTLWSTNLSIENRNFFALQKEISFELVAALKLNPLPTESQQLDKYPTLNNEAYENYLLGRSYLAKRSSDGLKKAIEKFTKAIELDGNFSLAYSGLSDAYSLLNLYEIEPPKDAYQMASKYAEKALELDPGLAEAHASLAYVKFFYERDRATSELEFRRAIQLNPSYAQAHHWFALVLVAMGKPLDAEAEIKIAERLDPQSPLVQTAYAMIYFFSGKENEALEKISQVLIKNPDFLPAIKVKRWTEQALKNFPEAHNAFLEEIRVTQSKPDDPSWQMIAVQTFKVTNDNLKQLEDRLMKDVADKKISQNYHSFAYEISLAYLNLGNTQKALEWLERAERSSNYSFNFLEVDPRLKPLNNNPRFLLLIKKLKSPVKHQA